MRNTVHRTHNLLSNWILSRLVVEYSFDCSRESKLSRPTTAIRCLLKHLFHKLLYVFLLHKLILVYSHKKKGVTTYILTRLASQNLNISEIETSALLKVVREHILNQHQRDVQSMMQRDSTYIVSASIRLKKPDLSKQLYLPSGCSIPSSIVSSSACFRLSSANTLRLPSLQEMQEHPIFVVGYIEVIVERLASLPFWN